MQDHTRSLGIDLKLIVDEEKKKVVFAEAGLKFVDILFSILTFPMGTIVRSIEKYQKSESRGIGCFNNIYASLANMEVTRFRTEACKQMLLFPRCLNQEKWQNNLWSIDDYEDAKIFLCLGFGISENCVPQYSYFNTSRCSCGSLMNKEISYDREGLPVRRINYHTSFIITDDLKVEVITACIALHTLKDLGLHKLQSFG